MVVVKIEGDELKFELVLEVDGLRMVAIKD